MRYRDCIIAWTAGDADPVEGKAQPGAVCVGPHPDKTGWSDAYANTVGGCMLAVKQWPLIRCMMQVMLDFNTLTAGEFIDPQAAHKEFLKIDEYRFHIAHDIEGADDAPEKYSREWNRELDGLLTRMAMAKYGECFRCP